MPEPAGRHALAGRRRRAGRYAVPVSNPSIVTWDAPSGRHALVAPARQPRRAGRYAVPARHAAAGPAPAPSRPAEFLPPLRPRRSGRYAAPPAPHAMVVRHGRPRNGHRRAERSGTRYGLLTIVALAVIGLGTTSYAGTRNSQRNEPACTGTAKLCMFTEPRFGGQRFTESAVNPTFGTCIDLIAQGWGGQARSVINTNRRAATMYPSTDCSGPGTPVYGNSRSEQIADTVNSVFVY